MTHPFLLTADETADVLNRTYADLAQRRHRGQSPHAQRDPVSGRVWYPLESVLDHIVERAEQVLAERPVFDSNGCRVPPPPASYVNGVRARIRTVSV